MKLAYETRDVKVEGEIGRTEYTIHLGPHILNVLSGLYSDIPLAIFREYATNMLDGHAKLAGVPVKKLTDKLIKNTPIIHLPNALEPWIEFRDFGFGMSEEHVRTIFTTYGLSDKWEDNNQVGGLGLGAKTAFCYEGCDQWQIMSRWNGTEHIYLATRNDRGMPELLHADSIPTDQPNGVSIRIPVAQKDFQAFYDVARKLLPYFPISFNVTGYKLTINPVFKKYGEGKSWYMPAVGESTGPKVIMGPIVYPLDSNKLFYNSNLNDLHRAVINSGLVMYFDVGELEITPSREAIKYTTKTTETLLKRIKSASEELQQEAQKELDNATSWWDAFKTAKKITEQGHQFSRHFRLKWKGESLDRDRDIKFKLFYAKYPDIKITKLHKTWGGRGGKGKITIAEWMVVPEEKDPVTQKVIRPEFIPADNTIFSIPGAFGEAQYIFIDDMPDGGKHRVRNILGMSQTGYVLEAKGITKKFVASLLDGGPDTIIRMTSELPEPPKITRAFSKTQLKYYDEYRNEWREINAKMGTPDFPADGDEVVYLPLFRKDVADGSVCADGKVQEVMTRLRRLNVLPKTLVLYGVPASRSSLANQDGWQNLDDYMRPLIEKKVDKDGDKLARKIAARNAHSMQEFRSVHTMVNFCATIKMDFNSHPLLEAARALVQDISKSTQGITQNEEDLRYLSQLLNIAFPDSSEEFPVVKMAGDLYEQYPFLVFVAENSGRGYGYEVKWNGHDRLMRACMDVKLKSTTTKKP